MKKWMLGLLAAVLVIVAGCQAVGGVDLNKMWLTSLDTKSYEGNSTLTLQMKLDPSMEQGMDEREKAVYDLLNGMKVNFTDMKVQDQQRFSVKGNVELTKGTIPFQAVLADQVVTIQAEGMKKPLKLDLMGMNNGGTDLLEFRELQKELADRSGPLQKQLIGFVSQHLPNPRNISVSSVTETVYGEQLNLHKVHAEVYASELLGLVKSFLQNVAADDEGMKALIGSLYDMFEPILAQQTAPGITGDSSSKLPDREQEIGMFHAMLKQQLNQLIANFDEETAGIDRSMLTDDNYLKVDLYLDDALKVRKSNVELAIAAHDGGNGTVPVELKVTSTSQMWHVNQPVAIDPINGQPLVVGADTNARQLFNNIDSKSLLYDVLKRDLDLARTTVTVYPDANTDEPGSGFFGRPYIKGEGTTMVADSWLSEQLGFQVTPNESEGRLTVQDPATGKQIVFVKGSKTAYVNGQEVQLEEAPGRADDSDFVPLRFVVEQFGGKVKWDEGIGAATVTMELE